AARRAGLSLISVGEAAARCAALAAEHDLALVEGAGGVLVRLDLTGGTILDLADSLATYGIDTSFIVVTSLALGTLNHTELTVGRIRASGPRVDGLVIGSLASDLGLAEQCNVDDLPRVSGVEVVGAIPAGAGRLGQQQFRAEAPTWFTDT